MKELQTLQYKPNGYDPERSLSFSARLMSPEEVSHVFAGRGQKTPPELVDRWSLCGDTSAAMFDRVGVKSAERMMTRLSTFVSSRGGGYLVLTNQVLTRQHRFLLPLWEPRAHDAVKALHREELAFMLGRNGGGEGMVFFSNLTPNEVEPVLQQCATHDVMTSMSLFAEFPLVVESLRSLEAIPCLYGMGLISEVALSTLLPTGVLESISTPVPKTQVA